jgi:predicted nucleotidyltransferase
MAEYSNKTMVLYMKKVFIIAAISLLCMACRTTEEKAIDRLQEIQKASAEGDVRKVKELVQEMTEWYEDLSEEDKKSVDDKLAKESLKLNNKR